MIYCIVNVALNGLVMYVPLLLHGKIVAENQSAYLVDFSKAIQEQRRNYDIRGSDESYKETYTLKSSCFTNKK